MEIVFAVGYENKVAVLNHPECNCWNETEIDQLYDEIEKGCPLIQEKNLSEGLYRGEFSSSGVKDLWLFRSGHFRKMMGYSEERIRACA